MADLDNFFAKKDRKKTKGQKFATSSDNMATGQEELQKKQDKQKKERSERSLTIQSNYATENDNKSSSKMLEEEWNEYQEEIKDYTTLKMQTLTADCPSSFTDNNDKDDEIEFEENEAGEMVPKRKNAGPWKLTEPEQPPPPPPKAAPPVVAEVQKKVYVPPAQRNNFQGGHRSAPRSKATSLDVKDEEMFPTLQGNNSTKKSVAPAARKVETPAWAKYQ
ncbi:protein CDV3 homolog [Aphis gossypii]|uniref:Protein CDV3 homolog n=1 Tax=Aphis gossypii TaxID=80765 RepID=A0A9P0J9I0_APHGO|nr:protein CDV3 homolog [Aphis gossypii]CAH1732813.1 unnamed protein product [Aphis gossypii]